MIAGYALVGSLVTYKTASKRLYPGVVTGVSGTTRNITLLSSRTAVAAVPLMTHRAASGPSWYPGSRSKIPV